jgi:hypothetical protein
MAVDAIWARQLQRPNFDATKRKLLRRTVASLLWSDLADSGCYRQMGASTAPGSRISAHKPCGLRLRMLTVPGGSGESQPGGSEALRAPPVPSNESDGPGGDGEPGRPPAGRFCALTRGGPPFLARPVAALAGLACRPASYRRARGARQTGRIMPLSCRPPQITDFCAWGWFYRFSRSLRKGSCKKQGACFTSIRRAIHIARPITPLWRDGLKLPRPIEVGAGTAMSFRGHATVRPSDPRSPPAR